MEFSPELPPVEEVTTPTATFTMINGRLELNPYIHAQLPLMPPSEIKNMEDVISSLTKENERLSERVDLLTLTGSKDNLVLLKENASLAEELKCSYKNHDILRTHFNVVASRQDNLCSNLCREKDTLKRQYDLMVARVEETKIAREKALGVIHEELTLLQNNLHLSSTLEECEECLQHIGAIKEKVCDLRFPM